MPSSTLCCENCGRANRPQASFCASCGKQLKSPKQLLAFEPACKQCGQPIVGRYITALGVTWHPEHFVCAACHKPIGDTSFNVHEGRPYHPDCYLQQVAPRCAYCDKPMLGQRQPYQEKLYHPGCYRDHVAPRCVFCAKPLIGDHCVNFWGDYYCTEHQAQWPACAFCGRLVPPQQQEAGPQKSDDIRCPTCRVDAVETLTQAQPLLAPLRQWLVGQGVTFNNKHLLFELCDRATLAVYRRARGAVRTPPNVPGICISTTRAVNGREVATEVDKIVILRGMPKVAFQDVSAHEMGHAWCVIQGIKGLPSWVEEGFCQLLSYRYCTELDTRESRYRAKGIEDHSDPVYGDGFRRIRAMVDRIGFRRFVEELRTSKRLPAG